MKTPFEDENLLRYIRDRLPKIATNHGEEIADSIENLLRDIESYLEACRALREIKG